MSAIRVLIADDDAVIRSSLRLLVEHEPGMSVSGEAPDGKQAIDLAREHRPDVVLMDVQMPRMNGLEATRALCSEVAGPRVIVLTMFDLDEYVFEALRAGASGFLLKNSPPSEVLRAIRVAYDGEALLAPEVTRRLIDRFAGPSRDHTEDSGVGRLTERERETLQLIGRGLSNAEIAAALFVTQTTRCAPMSAVSSRSSVRGIGRSWLWWRTSRGWSARCLRAEHRGLSTLAD